MAEKVGQECFSFAIGSCKIHICVAFFFFFWIWKEYLSETSILILFVVIRMACIILSHLISLSVIFSDE